MFFGKWIGAWFGDWNGELLQEEQPIQSRITYRLENWPTSKKGSELLGMKSHKVNWPKVETPVLAMRSNRVSTKKSISPSIYRSGKFR